MSWKGGAAVGIQSGTAATVNIPATGTNYAGSVTFPKPFPTPPTVLLQESSSSASACMISLNGKTEAGFNYVCQRAAGSGAFNFDWTAIPV